MSASMQPTLTRQHKGDLRELGKIRDNQREGEKRVRCQGVQDEIRECEKVCEYERNCEEIKEDWREGEDMNDT